MRATVRGPGGHGSLPMRGGTMARLAKLLRDLDRGRLPVHVTDVAAADDRGHRGGAARARRASPLRRAARPAPGRPRRCASSATRGRAFEPMLHNTVNATIVARRRQGQRRAERGDGRPRRPPAARLHRRRHAARAAGARRRRRRARGRPRTSPRPRRASTTACSTCSAACCASATRPARRSRMLLPGVTDGRTFARLGIQTLRLPARCSCRRSCGSREIIHAADERIPVDALEFGTGAISAVLERYGR